MFIGLSSVCAIGSFGASLASNYKEPINCVSLHDQPCKAGPTIVNIKSGKTLFYPFAISVNKGGGSFNTVDNHMD